MRTPALSLQVKSQQHETTPMPSISLLLANAFSSILFYVIIKGFQSFQDITDALAFYGVYHRDPINQVIHFFGVPMIIWSMFVFLSHLKVPLINWKICTPGAQSHHVNYATCLSAVYIMFYLYLDHFGGALFAPFLYFMYATAVSFTMKDQEQARKVRSPVTGKPKNEVIPWTGTARALQQALFIHLFGWYVQIHPGHKIFEGAAPAILQSLGGALSSAPLFAFYEGLWFIGLNTSLQETTLKLVAQYTQELCDSGAVTMRACANMAS